MARTPKGFPRPRDPRSYERDYEAKLVRRVRRTHEGMMRRLGVALKRVGPEMDARAKRYTAERRAGTRTDSPGSDLSELVQVVDYERQRWMDSPIGNEDLRRRGRAVSSYSAAEQERVFRAVYRIRSFAPLAVGGDIQAWVATNVDLIRSIDTRYFDDIERVVSEAVQTGRSTETLRKDLQRRYEVSESRARLIARDQISKLNGQIARERQVSLGATRYMWSTSGDERVRDRHAELDGQIFSWSDPPVINDQGDVGHPGDDFQCRCGAIPVLDQQGVEDLERDHAERKAAEAGKLARSPITTGAIIPTPRRAPSSKWFRELQKRVQASP
jgi:SPP1 gp7 family putative phage head morphogenesis protein